MGPQLFTQGKGLGMRNFVLAAVLVLMAGGAQAATLNVVGGQLMGASDVLVEGIGHTSCLLAQRPSLGVMLNP